MLRWGILSTGRIADWFCSDFGSVTNGNLQAVASRKLENAQAFAKKYDIPNAYGDYAEMLASDDVDAIYIGTPHTAHKQNVLDAFAAGKHVLCEKPIVTNVADAEELIAAAKSSGAYLMEAMWTWHLPAMQKAKEWVKEGRIGKLLHVKTDFGYPLPYSADRREYDANDAGGTLREMGIYPLAIARFFLDDLEAAADELHVLHREAPNGVEDDFTAIAHYGDVTTNVGSSYKTRQRNAAHILGDDGYIVIPDAFRCDRAVLYKIDDEIDRFVAERSEKGYHYQAIAMANDIAAGLQESPVMPLSASLILQKDIKAILDKTGRGELG